MREFGVVPHGAMWQPLKPLPYIGPEVLKQMLVDTNFQTVYKGPPRNAGLPFLVYNIYTPISTSD